MGEVIKGLFPTQLEESKGEVITGLFSNELEELYTTLKDDIDNYCENHKVLLITLLGMLDLIKLDLHNELNED